jgi:DNA-binding winged helix-turn-helix (wHTH) protein
LLKPLASESSFLETPHAAFKFFLPLDVGQQLQQAVTLRPDRMCIRTIVWDATALTDLIQQRLNYFSNGRVNRLEELCASGAKAQIMERFIQACDHSPRTLIRLCHDLIHHHVDRTEDALFDRGDISDTISDFMHRLETDVTPRSSAPLAHSIPTRTATMPDKGLFLNEHGHVYIDGQLLSPPLSEHEFRLLQTLYRYAPEIVSNQTLIETLWPEWGQNDDDAVVDDQNLRKLITRLLQRMPGEMGRYVRNVRGRGYWLETAP